MASPTGDAALGGRLAAALETVRTVFAGATARSDETNCDCHWGSPEELALLKTPDVPLDADLLLRTWSAPDWRDHPAVMRRILPQLAHALATGRADPWQVGPALARSRWPDWPGEQPEAVGGFLCAWWAHVLEQPQPPHPAREVFDTCVAASGTVTPWLAAWARCTTPAADRHLLAAVEAWEYDLIGAELPAPWHWDHSETTAAQELMAWLRRHAPARLAAHGADAELVRLVGSLVTPLVAR
ncbi:hypothetical protein [Streptomyces sp. NPDC049555]|uniref:hypothetical protein n=1 Tax=unclassified Streptomyces TaxID=2593676 RepID=UPI003434B0A1